VTIIHYSRSCPTRVTLAMPARTVHQILEYTKVDGTCHHERATQQREQDRRLFTTRKDIRCRLPRLCAIRSSESAWSQRRERFLLRTRNRYRRKHHGTNKINDSCEEHRSRPRRLCFDIFLESFGTGEMNKRTGLLRLMIVHIHPLRTGIATGATHVAERLAIPGRPG
jgi:hypothetical protein